MTDTYPPCQLHVHSIRLASGAEVLVARAVSSAGKQGFGFSFRLEATEARHMAEWHAGIRADRPAYSAVSDHPWERAWASHARIDWRLEPAFAAITWMPPIN